MSAFVRALLHGATDASQVAEACQLGVDGIVTEVREVAGAEAIDVDQAARLAWAIPPLVARVACLQPGGALPAGWHGAVTGIDEDRPAGALWHFVRVGQEGLTFDRIPEDVDAVWIRPVRSSAGAAFNYTFVERIGRRYPVLLEIPDGAGGVEVAMRLGRPAAVVFGEAVWLQPGIVDLDRLERALAVVARLNRSILSF